MSAIIEYQWIKIYKDDQGNDRFIPQFCEDGTQQFWNDSKDVHPYKLLLVPLSAEIAEKLVSKKIPAISAPLTKYTFLLQPDDHITAYWENEITVTSHYTCSVCGNNWTHLDSSKFVQCPNCNATDIWICRRCPVDIPIDIARQKAIKEIEYNAATQKLQLAYNGTSDEHEKEEIRKKQLISKDAMDTWLVQNNAVKIIDQSRVHKNTALDESMDRGKLGEINCPDCTIPYGLNRKVMLHKVNDIIENTDYTILCENKFKIMIINSNEVIIESL